MRSYLLFFLFVIIAGCKNTNSDKNSTPKVVDIKQLEADYQKSKSDSLTVQLIYAYGQEISNTQNKEDKLNYLKKALTLVRKSDYDEYRKVFLMELIKTDPLGTSDELLELGNFFEDEENTDLQSIIFLGFKHRFPKDPRNKDFAHKIFLQLGDHRLYFKNLLSEVFEKTENGDINIENGRTYVEQVTAFALGFSDDPKTPEYLMISADVARAIGDPNTTIGQYDWVYKYYPNYSKAPLALFLKGYEIENSLHRYDDAKKVYETFLKSYPKDTLAKDVRYMISNLGKSDADVFKEMKPIEQ